nr:DNA replication/repair protein RecF [Anaerolineae bacterium]
MHITHLSLTNFRNYARLEQSFPDGVIILYGNNAQGKTSLLESIYYMATSRSPYTQSDRQLISWLVLGDPLPFARLVAEISTAEGLKRVEVTLAKKLVGKSYRFVKEIRVNGLPRKVMDLLGQIRVVLFLPQDMALVEGSPSERRRYLNITLCQTNPDYCRALNQYEKVLKQRNALLKQLQENDQRRGRRSDTSQLAFWDEKLAAHGACLIAGRFRLVKELETRAQAIHRDLSGQDENLRMRYEPGFDVTDQPSGQMGFSTGDLGASALPQLPQEEITSLFIDSLRKNYALDISRGITTIGPQRDELRFLINGYDLGIYGSRGQGRTTVLALKLAELTWMEEQTGEPPILLLDEVAAELDPHRRGYLLERIDNVRQVLMTTAEPALLEDMLHVGATRWRVKAGAIEHTD